MILEILEPLSFVPLEPHLRSVYTDRSGRNHCVLLPDNAAVQRPRAELSSAQQAHNEMARLLRASDAVSRSAATAC
jgi:hypothetical protein